MEKQGKLIMVVGLLIAGVGLVVWACGDKLRFIGRLPGDIRIERENMKIYIPITTMLLLSLLLTLLSWLVRKFN